MDMWYFIDLKLAISKALTDEALESYYYHQSIENGILAIWNDTRTISYLFDSISESLTTLSFDQIGQLLVIVYSLGRIQNGMELRMQNAWIQYVV